MPVVDAAGLTRCFGTVRALDGLDLAVERGELYGLLGPNGAGKTTTLEILTGQLRPDGGTVSVLGTDPVADPIETRRRVGILPEQARPPSFLTPREYFDFVGAVRELDDEAVRERRETWAERLGFAEKLDTYCTDLSRGQQQKVLVAATFLHDPALAFIDEPLANLDPIVQEQLKRYLRSYVADGNTLVLSTHHIEVAAELCTRVGIVSDGRMIAERAGDAVGDGDQLLETFLSHVEGDAAAEARDLAGIDPNGATGTSTEGPVEATVGDASNGAPTDAGTE